MVHYSRRERGKETERLRIKAITFEWHHILVENLLIEKKKKKETEKKRLKKREIDRETERQRERAQG